jgi:hypothetical protein
MKLVSRNANQHDAKGCVIACFAIVMSAFLSIAAIKIVYFAAGLWGHT